MKRWLPIPLALLATIPACNTGSQDEAAHERIESKIFGTHYRISYCSEADPEAVQAAIEAELKRIDWMASNWKAESELMRYNRSEDREDVELSAELAGLLERAEEIKKWTGGAFDAGFDGQQIDLSGIAKGYAVDRLTDLLTGRFGADSCLVDIGGEIRVHGPGPGGGTWNIGIYLPANERGVELPKLELRDTSIATSGTSFRGEHLINPKDGKAARTGLLCASVIHPSNTTADALSTALYVMGPEKGLEWAREHNIQAIFVLEDGEMREHRCD